MMQMESKMKSKMEMKWWLYTLVKFEQDIGAVQLLRARFVMSGF